MCFLVVIFAICMLVMLGLFKFINVSGALHRMFIFLALMFLLIIVAIVTHTMQLVAIAVLLFASIIYLDFKKN